MAENRSTDRGVRRPATGGSTMTAVPHWEHQDHLERDHTGGAATYSPEASCPYKVTSMRELTPGKPTLTDEAMGWLAYSHRRTSALGGKWGKGDVVHASWDNKTGTPIDNHYRYDLTFSTFAIALMAHHTPSRREYSSIILYITSPRLVDYTTFFCFVHSNPPPAQHNNHPGWYYD